MDNKDKKLENAKDITEDLSKISEAVISDLHIEDVLKLIVTVTAEVIGSKICLHVWNLNQNMGR